MIGLPILRHTDMPVARLADQVIPATGFLHEIMELAERLPSAPFVVNLCTDRYRFTVAMMAAMLRGQVTLLPTSRDAAAVTALCADHDPLYVLTDQPETWPASVFAYPAWRSTGTETRCPTFSPDQVAAVLFTSGSTGQPNRSPRSWGRLVAGSLAAGTALGVEHFRGSALVATVPHAHSYGLESAVMLPLQHGLLLTADRPFFPTDVAAALDRGPSILVTTPIHLRALVGDAASADLGAGFTAGLVLSATAPLSADLAARAEAAFSAPVFEIYGCSEAGQLATRRTVAGPVWRTLDGFRLYATPTGCWAAGPVEDDVPLADAIKPVDDDHFILQGRTADLVNIAGKRSSLAYLTRQLLSIAGVLDGAFVMQDDNAAGATPRLAAIACAPGLSAPSILEELRTRIEPAFLPRPLHVVDALPRNELGKLPRAELLRLIGLPHMLHFPVDHPAGPGHFPGNPIIPGAALLDDLVMALFPGGWSGTIDAAKFHHPVRPGDTVAVTHTAAGDATRFEARRAHDDQLVVSGVLRFSSPAP